MFKSIIKALLVKWLPILAILGLVYFMLSKWAGSFSPAKWFQSKPVVIDETPWVISKIRELALLQTAKLYCEVIADSAIITQNDMVTQGIRNAILRPFIPTTPVPSKQIVMVVRGQVVAGINLAGITQDHINIRGDTAILQLPSAQILDVIANPSGIEIFSEEGVWTSEEKILVTQKAMRNMKEEAINRQLITTANNRAKVLMENFLKAAGFAVAMVEIK